MRGQDSQQPQIFSFISPEERVPGDHPLSPIRLMVDKALQGPESSMFDGLYSYTGRKRTVRPSPPDDPGNPDVDIHGEKRKNETHASTSDRDCRQFKKSKGEPALQSNMGHVLMENRKGLVVKPTFTQAGGTAERDASLEMVQVIPGNRRVTLGGDKNYDTRYHVAPLRSLNVTPHVAQNDTNRKSAIDGRTIRHPGYAVSMRKRKGVEEIFGWMKTVGLMRKTRHRSKKRVDWMFAYTAAAYNLVRMRNLAPEV